MKENLFPTFKKDKDGCFTILNISGLECLYLFTNKDYALFDNDNQIIGWKDMSGNNNHIYFKK